MADGNESNWWPGPPQPNQGPGGYADPRSPGGRVGPPPWEQQAQPSWGGAHDPAGARGPRPADPRRPDPRLPDPPRFDPRRDPEPRRDPDQWGDPDPRQDADQWDWMADGGRDDRPDGRGRQYPGAAAEAAPYPAAPNGRHRSDSPGAHPGPAGRDGKRGSSRVLTFVGGGALVAIVLVAMGLGLSRGGGTAGAASVQVTESAGVAPTVTAADAGPGTPTVTARSAGQQAEFSWSYANAAASDTFRVQVSGGGKPTVVDKPDFTLSVAQGQQACIQVQVVSASGITSAESSQVCSPS